jgi:hemerythrin-like domain-containing protein
LAKNRADAQSRTEGERLESIMKDPVLRWHDEHMRFARLLDYLDKQMVAFHEGGAPDYEFIGDIVFYLKEYADRQHHQREDVAFRILAERDPTLKPLIQRLLQEHRVIDTAGDAFHDHLVNILNGMIVRREVVEAAAATYLVYYRAHIQTEETQILPVAARLLTENDWKAVADAVDSAPDPVFGAEEVGVTYRAMRARMLLDATAAA